MQINGIIDTVRVPSIEPSCSAQHRTLHSAPTRRSSDLSSERGAATRVMLEIGFRAKERPRSKTEWSQVATVATCRWLEPSPVRNPTEALPGGYCPRTREYYSP